MDQKAVINELMSIEAGAFLLIERATKLRKRLEGVHSPTSRKGGLSEKEKVKLLTKRRRTIISKCHP